MTREEFIENILKEGFYKPGKQAAEARGWPWVKRDTFLLFFYDYDLNTYLAIEINVNGPPWIYFTLWYLRDPDSLYAETRYQEEGLEQFTSYKEAWEYITED